MTEDRDLEAAESVESGVSLPVISDSDSDSEEINSCCCITWLVLVYLLGEIVLGLAVHLLCKEYYCF